MQKIELKVGTIYQVLYPKNISMSYRWITRIEDGNIYARAKKRHVALCDMKYMRKENWGEEHLLPKQVVCFNGMYCDKV